LYIYIYICIYICLSICRLFLAAVAYDLPTSTFYKKSYEEIESFFTNNEPDEVIIESATEVGGIASILNAADDEERSNIKGSLVRREKKKYNLTKTNPVGTPMYVHVYMYICI
jgi:hypothetical protein